MVSNLSFKLKSPWAGLYGESKQIKSGLEFIIQIFYRAGIYYSEICKNCFKIVGEKKNFFKMIGMTWPLTWRNVSAAILNATLQLLVISRYRCELIATEYLIITQIIDDLNLSLNQTILNLLIEPHKLIYTLQSMVLYVYSNKTKFGIYTKR